EQHRRAIGGEDAERDLRRGGHHGVGARPALARPRPVDGDDLRTVDLVASDELVGGAAQRRGGAAAILQHFRLVVAGAQAAIERREDALADAAVAGEEGVADAAGGERVRSDQAARPSLSPAGAGSDGCASASTLNTLPISSGSIKRRQAASIAAACAGVARSLSAAARVARPSATRNAPCVTGPQARAPAAVAAAANVAKSTCAVRSAVPGSASTSWRRWFLTACKVSPQALAA